jgi:hypothetical protein
VIVLAVRELTPRLFIYTLGAAKVILPLLVRYWPLVFVILLVAVRVDVSRLPVDNVPPVLSMKAFTALNVDTLSAISDVSTVRLVIARSWVVK